MTARTLIVCAHGGAADIVEMNEPNWLEFFEEIIVISPTDDPIEGTETHGFSGHHGPNAIERAINAFRRASEYPCACCAEADCLFFKTPAVQDAVVLCAQVAPNHDGNFKAPFFPHPPLWATGETFLAIADALPMFDEGGWGDRELGLVLPFLGLRMKGIGFSRNSIDRPDLITLALQAVQQGASCVHGVKTREVRDTLMQAARMGRIGLPLGY